MGSSILWSYLAQFFVQAQKNKKVNPEKNSLFYRKWNFLPLILKKFQETETLKKASYISGNGTFQSTLRKCLIFKETETPKKFLIFSQRKLFLYLGNGNHEKCFLYFRKRNFLIFRKSIFRTRSIFKTLTYLEPETYSEQ